MNKQEIYDCFWVRFESHATLLFLKTLQRGMLTDKKGEANQLFRRNRWVVQYSGAELEPYIGIYISFSMFYT